VKYAYLRVDQKPKVNFVEIKVHLSFPLHDRRTVCIGWQVMGSGGNILEEIMMTEHDAFQEARRIVGETGQTTFVFYTKHYHRSPDGVIQGVTRQYDVGLAVPPHGVQVGDKLCPYSAAQIVESLAINLDGLQNFFPRNVPATGILA
jgi:hypothetical protein